MLVIVAPSIEFTVLSDGERVAESANDLLDGLSIALGVFWDFDFDWLPDPRLVERRCNSTSFATGTALAERVIAHRHQCALLIQEHDMIKAACYLLNITQILDLFRCIEDHELTSYLRRRTVLAVDL